MDFMIAAVCVCSDVTMSSLIQWSSEEIGSVFLYVSNKQHMTDSAIRSHNSCNINVFTASYSS